MPDHTSTDIEAEVLVVGAGVIGCAVARELAPTHDVVVVDRSGIATGATALAAGEVTVSSSYTDALDVAAHANEFFHAFDGTGQFEYEPRHSLELVPAGNESHVRRRVDRLRGKGVRVEYLDADAVAERYPRINADPLDGGVRHEDTGFVDPYTFAIALKNEAEDRGVTFRTDVTVTDIVTDGNGSVTGVDTESGVIEASTVVAAAGWRTERLLRDRVQLPVRPYRTQCVVLEPTEPLGREDPMGWIPGEHVYFRPELNGDFLVGGWSFAEDEPETASEREDEAFRNHVAELLPRFFRSFDDARFVNGWAGVDGATPDTRPIIDTPQAGPEGLVVATGFHGRGVMTAPVAATLVRCLVDDESPPFDRSHFRLDRFESCSPDFEFQSISAGDYGDDDERVDG